MPRRARVILPGTPLHLIQRGNNRCACFFDDQDYQFYLEWLGEYAKQTGCSVHAYVLMTNHVHLLVSGRTSRSVGDLMKRLGQRYVQYVNRTYRRSGTLWEGRFRSCLTREESYVLACYRYIELNPVRAGIVAHPGEYRWSSYDVNAQQGASSFLVSHETYERLGGSEEDRRAAYRELFRSDLEPEMVDKIRKATNGNYALGSERFAEEVALMLARRVPPGRSGRPRKPDVDRNGDLF